MANAWMNARLKQYLEAEKAILVGGQSYRIGNRTLTRADLAEIRSEIKSLVAAGYGRRKPADARATYSAVYFA